MIYIFLSHCSSSRSLNFDDFHIQCNRPANPQYYSIVVCPFRTNISALPSTWCSHMPFCCQAMVGDVTHLNPMEYDDHFALIKQKLIETLHFLSSSYIWFALFSNPSHPVSPTAHSLQVQTAVCTFWAVAYSHRQFGNSSLVICTETQITSLNLVDYETSAEVIQLD